MTISKSNTARPGSTEAFDTGTGLHLVALFVLSVVTYVWYASNSLWSDVSYLIVATGRILDGAWPYRDILETNPPLIFLVTIPPVYLAKQFAVSSHHLFIAYVLLLAWGSILSCRQLCVAAGQPRTSARDLMTALFLALLILPNQAFGQREHFAAILACPYLVVCALRWGGASPGRVAAAAAGLAAGVGLALKPHLFLVPATIELGALYLGGRWRNFVRAETIAVVLPAVLYPGLVGWLTPDYLTKIVPLLRLTYGAYGNPLLGQLASPQFVMGLAGLLYSANVLRRHQMPNAIALVLVLAATGSLAAYLVQAKGWYYQAYPAYAFTLAALFYVTICLFRQNSARGPLAAVWIAGLVFIVANHVQWISQQTIWRQNLALILDGYKPRRIMAITHDLGVPFPYIYNNDIEWGSSFPSLWMMPAVSTAELDAVTRQELIRMAAEIVARDLKDMSPDFVIVDGRSETPTLKGKTIPYLQLFGAYPEFNEIWANYRRVKQVATFELWQRMSD